MDYIDRYISAVTKKIPQKQRHEIENELRTKIEDMIKAEKELDTYEKKTEKVLLVLGDPQFIADKYRGIERYIIGPKYYDTYVLILKILLLTVSGGITIALFVANLVNPNPNFLDAASNYLGSLFSATLQTFAWVTILFFIIERRNISKGILTLDDTEWNLSKLPPLSNKKVDIPFFQTVFSLILIAVFYTVFIAILYIKPQLIAAHIFNGEEIIIIPIFNADEIKSFNTAITAIFIFGILKEILKLYYKRWELKLSVLYAILSIISTILIIYVLTDDNIWNPDFADEVVKNITLDINFYSLWEKIQSWIVIIISALAALEIINVLYKGIRFRRN